ncbi:MAG: methylmalonyl Co-A mutase-associated GTPase MeaB [Actinomycetota bacterium]
MPGAASATELAERALVGDRRSIAKVLSLVEQGGDGAREAVAALHGRTGRAWTIGITGAPGAGKSTLTDALVVRLRADGDEVGVLAVDPSSPFSGGAILGDRVRMHHHTTDTGVFIRSMASRGHLGGLALSTPQAVRVLDAVGKAWVVVETVGVGQVEVEVAGHTDTVVVVVNPGWGDAVQAAKAGLLEGADIFVVNKADRTGVDDAVADLRGMLELSGNPDWVPPVVRTVATTGEGVDELFAEIRRHRAHLERTGTAEARRLDRLRAELRGIVAARLAEQAADRCRGERFEAAVAAVAARELDPYRAAGALLT